MREKPLEVNWQAVSAIGTIILAIIAFWGPHWWEIKKRPRLEFRLPDYTERYLRYTHGYQTGPNLQSIEIQIINTGKTVANRCQIVLSKAGVKKNDSWEKFPEWVPIGFYWGLEPDNSTRNNYEKDIVPQYPYYFVLGRVSHINPNRLDLRLFNIPTGRMIYNYEPGEYCFEITVFAENAKVVKKYFYVTWKGEYKENSREMKNHLTVIARDYPPRWEDQNRYLSKF